MTTSNEEEKRDTAVDLANKVPSEIFTLRGSSR